MSRRSKRKAISKQIYNPREPLQSVLIVNDEQPNPDRLFENASVDYEKYLDLLYSDVVKKCDNGAKSFAKNYPSSIDQGESSKEVFEYIQGLWDGKIQGINLKKAQDTILNYILPGFSVTQLIQGFDDKGNKTIVEAISQPQNYFVFTQKGDLILSNIVVGSKKLDQDLEFLVVRDEIQGGNFYGVGVAQSIYYDSEILKDLNKFVHQTASKSAVPPVVVIHENLGSTKKDVRENSQATSTTFQKLRSGSAVSIAKVKDVKELKGGNPQILVNVLRIYEAKIGERYNGSAEFLQYFTGGSEAKLKVLWDVIKVFAEPRNIILEEGMNELIKRVVRVRFGNVEVPRLVFDRNEKPDAKLILEYVNAGIAVKTESMPDFVGEDEEIFRKTIETTPTNFSDNSKKKTLQVTLN